MKKLLLALPILSGLALAAACSGDDPQNKPGPTPGADGGADAPSGDANPAPRPTLDPTKGSFADARSKVEAIIVQGRDAELQATDRLFPSSDPLALASAIIEVQRAGDTSACTGSQFGCPDGASAAAFIAEYKANRAALGAALKKMQGVQHGWARIGVAGILIGLLNVLEQAKALDAKELEDLKAAAATFTAALAADQPTQGNGMYPEIPAGAPLFRFLFSQVRPAPAPSTGQVAAANTFVTAVFSRLGVLAIGPKPEDPLNGLVARLKKGLTDQGIIVQGIIVQGSEAGRLLDALPYFITVPEAVPTAKVDVYLGTIDDLLDKLGANAVTAADWSKYAAATDDLLGSFDAGAGALESSVAPAALGALVDVPADLEVDPNVNTRADTNDILRKSVFVDDVFVAPSLNLRTRAPVRTTIAERRTPIAVPADVGPVDLPARPAPVLATSELVASTPLELLLVGWEVRTSKARLDHVDLRIENLTTKKRVFHKVYRTQADGRIAIQTGIRVSPDWFQPGKNELQIKAVAVDRFGRSSGVVCGSLATAVDAKGGVNGTGDPTCFRQAESVSTRPFNLAAGGADVILGSYKGTPYRPTFVYKPDSVSVFNDTTKGRQLRSLFTPEYAEFLPIDRSLRKFEAAPIAPLDTATFGAGLPGTISLPAGSTNVTFAFVDEANAPRERLFVTNGLPTHSFW